MKIYLQVLIPIGLLMLVSSHLRSQSCTNCGVGIVSPTSKFHIEGCSPDDSTASSFRVDNSSNSPLFFVRNDGWVGINTIYPKTQFQVQGTKTGGINMYYSVGNPRLSLFPSNSTSIPKFSLGLDNSDSYKFKIGTDSINKNTRLTIDASGYVGIGTTSPGQLFSVGSSNQFQINSSGDVVTLKGVTYSWPSANSSGVLTNNGSGTLTWTALSGSYWGTSGNAGLAAGSYLGTSDAVDLVVKTNGTERLRILSTGNLGFGTNSPQSLVHLSTSGTTSSKVLQLTNSTTGATSTDGFLFRSSSGDGNDMELVQQENANVKIYTNSTERLRITSSGDLGFGNVSPQSLFHLNTSGTTSSKVLQFTNSTTGSTSTDGFLFRSSSSSGNDMEFVQQENANIMFYTNGSERFRINSSGSLGIGTTGPDRILDVLSTSEQLRLTYTDGSVYTDFKTTSSGNLYISPSNGIVTLGSSSPSTYPILYVEQTSTSDDKIGVHVVKAEPGNAAYQGYGIQSTITCGTGYAFGVYGSSYNASASSGRAYGIWGQAGNATTGYNYGVYGHIAGSNNGTGIYGSDGAGDASIGAKYAGYFNGKIRTTNDSPEKPTAGSWTGYSDQRLKQDISNFTGGLSILRQINPITYKFNGIGGLPTGKTFYGIVAQQMQNVFPACIENGNIVIDESDRGAFPNAVFLATDSVNGTPVNKYVVNDVLKYNPDAVFYIMINAIKELEVEKNSLITEIDNLKARLTALENK